jgi:phage gp29-like protein
VLNIGGIEDIRRCPSFVFDLRESEDLSLYADALPKLVDVGLPVPISWVQDKLRIPAPEKDEAVLMRSQPAMPEPEPTSNTRLARATANLDDQDEFDIFADELASDWERVTDPLITPVIALAARVENFEDFQKGLAKLVESMDTKKLTETLAQGQFAAAIYGRVRNQKP